MPRPHNLPRELSSFVGRARASAELQRLLDDSLLVTLVGVGGAGKTRLALHVARALAERDGASLADGVWLLELAPLSEADLVPRAVAGALGVPEHPGEPITTTLETSLRSRHLLLLLDNCEHLIAACAALAERLLQTCPGLRILATSREPLGVPGEVAWRVPPLDLPEGPEPDAIGASEAGRLFLDRAWSAQPGFALTAENAAAVAEVCLRLDGIPLAIELAAARVAALGPRDLAARLDDSIRLLAGGSRTAPRRQQSLEAAVRWSYDLLSREERQLFDRLAVFAGTFALESAEALAGELGAVPQLLASLVAKSLVQAEPRSDGTMRYRLLEPLRQFGWRHLLECGELEALRDRHADEMIALAERGIPQLRGPDQLHWFARLGAEDQNIRAALAWLQANGDAARALRLAAALEWWWSKPDRRAEGRERLTAILALAAEADDAPRRARVMATLGSLFVMSGDLAAAEQWLEAALRTTEDVRVMAEALSMQANVYLFRGDHARAQGLLEQGLELSRAHGLRWYETRHLSVLGEVALARNDCDAAVDLIQSAVDIARAEGDTWNQAMTLMGLGDALRSRGDYDRAGAAYEESGELFLRTDAASSAAWAAGLRHNLAYVALARGDTAAATRGFLEGADLYAQQGPDRRGMAECVMGLAAVLLRLRNAELAARLFGAAEAALERLGTGFSPSNRGDHARALAALRVSLGPEALAGAWRAGRQMSLDAALQVARSQDVGRPRPPAPRGSDALTERELEVARLVARGYTNRQVADALVIAEKTAANHVQHVLDKLGVRSRTELAARAAELGVASAAGSVARSGHSPA